jgi:hypothetical protein
VLRLGTPGGEPDERRGKRDEEKGSERAFLHGLPPLLVGPSLFLP